MARVVGFYKDSRGRTRPITRRGTSSDYKIGEGSRISSKGSRVKQLEGILGVPPKHEGEYETWTQLHEDELSEYESLTGMAYGED